MTRRTLALLALSLVTAAACARLGVWQLSRLRERRARNAAVAARFDAPPVGLGALPTDTGALHYRRVRVAGRADYAREFVLANRSRDGSPGVHVVTPVAVTGRDTMVLVNRGWIYAPDGATVELARWREGDSLAVEGYVELPSRRPGAARLAGQRAVTAYRWLDPVEVARAVGRPVSTYYVAAAAPAGETASPADRPVRLEPPALDEGSHQSYAVQWFSFAAVALVGGAAFARAQQRR